MDARKRVIVLLERISEHEAGRHWWRAVSRFEKLAFLRIKREVEVAERRAREAEDGGVAVRGGTKKSPFIGLRES